MIRYIFGRPVMLVVTAAVLMLFLPALPASAQQTNPCTKDFKQYCPDVTPGGGRLLRCYEERKDKMSAECRAWAEAAKANAVIAREACAKEIDLLCSFHKGDPFGMLDCLQGEYINLSPECSAKLNEFKWRYPKPAR